MDDATTQNIQIPFPNATDLQLRIIMGPGQLRLSPATEGDWVSGTYRDPTGSIPLRVETIGSKARISQSVHVSNIPKPRGAPVLDLKLGIGKSYTLIIEGGANEIDADFSTLPLTRLECRFGAGQAKFRFDSANPQAMERFQMSAGAAEVRVTGLANANAVDIQIESGAAALHLDFGGTLSRDQRARINVGAASVDIDVPASTAARIAAHTVLSGVDIGDGFQTKDGSYWTAAAIAGATPTLIIDATVALAGLKLRAR